MSADGQNDGECQGDHEHVRLEGAGLTKKAESHPAMLAKSIFGVVCQLKKLKLDANMAKHPVHLMIPAMLHQCAEDVGVSCARKSMIHFDVNPPIPTQWDSVVVRRTIDRRTGVVIAEDVPCSLDHQQLQCPFQGESPKDVVT